MQPPAPDPLAAWTQYSTMATAAATVVYVVFTGVLVWVTRKQARIAQRQADVAQRQADIAARQTAIAALQTELQGQEAVTAAVTALSAAAIEAHELWIQANGIAPLMTNLAPLQGNPAILKFFDDYLAFLSRHYPMLRAYLGAGHQDLAGLMHLRMVVRDSRSQQKWLYVDDLRAHYGGAPQLLDQVGDLVFKEQERQATVLQEARAERVAAQHTLPALPTG